MFRVFRCDCVSQCACRAFYANCWLCADEERSQGGVLEEHTQRLSACACRHLAWIAGCVWMRSSLVCGQAHPSFQPEDLQKEQSVT